MALKVTNDLDRFVGRERSSLEVLAIRKAKPLIDTPEPVISLAEWARGG
jgi:hypothetical protein